MSMFFTFEGGRPVDNWQEVTLTAETAVTVYFIPDAYRRLKLHYITVYNGDDVARDITVRIMRGTSTVVMLLDSYTLDPGKFKTVEVNGWILKATHKIKIEFSAGSGGSGGTGTVSIVGMEVG